MGDHAWSAKFFSNATCLSEKAYGSVRETEDRPDGASARISAPSAEPGDLSTTDPSSTLR